jgi:PDZ domain-containing protein
VVVAADDDAALRVGSALAEALGAELHAVPAPDVTALAHELPDPLVCLSAGSRRRRPVLGPMAAAALADIGAPLLLVAHELPPASRNLLVYADGSAASSVATAVATAWAGLLGLDLWILGVVSPGRGAELGAADVELLASGHLALLARRVAAAGGTAQWDVLHGSSPESAIADHARRQGAALVVLGVDGTDGRLATMVSRLVEDSPAPVLVVPESVAAPMAPAIPLRRPPAAVLVSLPPSEPKHRPRRRPVGRMVALAGGVVLALASAHVTVPYYSVRPGVAREGRLRIEGATAYPPAGRILFTTASVRRATVAGMLRGWLDGDIDVVHTSRAPMGQGDQAEQLNRGLMAVSKTTAMDVALHRLGYPVRVWADIDSGEVGGPSAGLAFTLALLDRLTPGELTGGHTVAVTGTIASDGSVGPVGALGQKVAAARRAGAEVMIVPRSVWGAGVLRNRGPMQVVPVDDLAEALAVLAGLGGDPLS